MQHCMACALTRYVHQCGMISVHKIVSQIYSNVPAGRQLLFLSVLVHTIEISFQGVSNLF